MRGPLKCLKIAQQTGRWLAFSTESSPELGVDTVQCWGHRAEDIPSDGAPISAGLVVENDSTGSIAVIC